MNTQLKLFENDDQSMNAITSIKDAPSHKKKKSTKKVINYQYHRYERKLTDTAKKELEKMKQILLHKKAS